MGLLLLAVIPPLFLVRYVYKMDKAEKEPMSLIIRVFLLGVLSVVPILFAEVAAEGIVTSFLDESTYLFLFVDNIIGVALIEEFGKYLAARSIWKRPEFNYRFDAIVYTVVAALGFAAIENIMYVLEEGFLVGIMRAVLSIPGHAVDGIFMGVFFGQAKYCEVRGDKRGKKKNLRKAIWIPTILHGIYDALLSFEQDAAVLIFLVFVIALYVYAFRMLKKYSKEDGAFRNAADSIY